jgi:NodT family efflux transporter outer membrane factor (OMF) lipoprotein
MLKLLLYILLCSCTLGPNYQKPAPSIKLPESFHEAGVDWKSISPIDEVHGNWWEMFKDEVLNQLMAKLNKRNLNIKAAQSGYNQALALVDKTKVELLPSINADYGLSKSKAIPRSFSYTSKANFTASWELDLWGKVSRQLEQSSANADIAAINLEAIKLSSQTSLGQYYFQAKRLESKQQVLDKIVTLSSKILQYTQNRQLSGLSDDGMLAQISMQLDEALMNSANNQINLRQYLHAIAVLVGEAAGDFTLASSTFDTNISIPLQIPSQVLEKRTDVVAAERAVAAQNAQIGITKSAFFPSFTLNGNLAYQGSAIKRLMRLPQALWAVGPALALNITNLLAYKPAMKYAKEGYEQAVANYQATVLGALQDVEDNLVSLRQLSIELKIQEQAYRKSRRYLMVVQNQYQMGIIDQLALNNAKILRLNTEQKLMELKVQKLLAAISLIKAIGGRW